MTATTDRLPFTGDDEADRLLVADPLALLIGFALDQQVTVQKAFSGPLELQRRLGHLDAARIAAMAPEDLDIVFRKPPAIHRFPGSMAGKVQALCAAIAEDYGHATVDYCFRLAEAADVRCLVLFHHSPVRVDDDVDRLCDLAPPGLDATIAREGDVITL